MSPTKIIIFYSIFFFFFYIFLIFYLFFFFFYSLSFFIFFSIFYSFSFTSSSSSSSQQFQILHTFNLFFLLQFVSLLLVDFSTPSIPSIFHSFILPSFHLFILPFSLRPQHHLRLVGGYLKHEYAKTQLRLL